MAMAKELVIQFHYSHSAPRSYAYIHGLFKAKGKKCYGLVWWSPPINGAAQYVAGDRWKEVLALSRMIVVPRTPKNACSFLISRSIRLIDRNRWPLFLTFADTWQGHDGLVYKSSNWVYAGMTKPTKVYVMEGRSVSTKSTRNNRNHQEMLELGATCIGSFPKHRFIFGDYPKRLTKE